MASGDFPSDPFAGAGLPWVTSSVLQDMLGDDSHPDLSKQNEALAAENARLAQENEIARHHAMLAMENIRLSQENAFLMRQNVCMQGLAVPPTLGAGLGGFPWWPGMEQWVPGAREALVGAYFQHCGMLPPPMPMTAAGLPTPDTSNRGVSTSTPQAGSSRRSSYVWSVLRDRAKGGRGSLDSDASSLDSTRSPQSLQGSAVASSNNDPAERSASSDTSEGHEAEPLADSRRTTVMMRNIPNNYTRHMLVALVNSRGFRGSYDMLYVPMDFQTQTGLGYAFVNLVSYEEAERLRRAFDGFRNWSCLSEKVCEVVWSDVLQGLEGHVERYRNSPVMHESVPDDFKPALFVGGERVPFPPPTKRIRAPWLMPHAAGASPSSRSNNKQRDRRGSGKAAPTDGATSIQ